MSISALFALIAASIFALMPVLLLLGRRRMLRRDQPAEPQSATGTRGEDSLPAGRRSAGAGPSQAQPAAERTPESRRAGPAERPSMSRSDFAASKPRTPSTAPGLGEQPILDRLIREGRESRREEVEQRELREAAIIAGAESGSLGTGADQPGEPIAVASSAGEGGQRTWASFEERLAYLSPLKRAIVYGDVLGKPVSMRGNGGMRGV